VAIKVLLPERMGDENRRRRFVQEARAASALSHPNIVTIFEIESEADVDFMVMEYVPGKTLDALIPRQGLGLGEVLRIAIPIADAVARAHAAGIIHRDLKPANVMIGPEGVVKNPLHERCEGRRRRDDDRELPVTAAGLGQKARRTTI